MKKIVSLVIVITMMLCMFPVSSLTASATTTEFKGFVDLSEYKDGDIYKDEITEIEYEVIKTAENFKKIDKTENCIFGCPIDMEGEPFTNNVFGDGTSIQGIIDGNGFSLYNFSVTYGANYGAVGLLAQSLKGNATIKNLTIGTPDEPIDYKINGSVAQTAGALVGKIHKDTAANQTVTISNVHVYCNMTFQKALKTQVNLGGFVGITESGSNAYTLNITDSSFTGSITFADTAVNSGNSTNVGGLVGSHQMGTLNITNSKNYANIDITKRTSGSTRAFAGGMVGNANAQASFTNCVNSGDISSDRFAGGIIGGTYFTSSNDYVFNYTNCVNHGDVSSNSGDSTEKAAAGGIIGITEMTTQVIKECGNTGNISASRVYSNNELPKLGACGIIGRYYVDNSNTIITDCYSTGVILSTVTDSTTMFTPYALCTGSIKDTSIKLKVTGCVWNMTYNDNAVENGLPTTNLSADSGNNIQKNIIAKTSTKAYDAYAQKSSDNTMLRILLVSATPDLLGETNIVINVYYGDNQGKKFTVPASYIFALHSVEAAGEMYYAADDAYIFGGVITGIPENITITRVEVEYGNDFFWNIPMGD